jgi:cell wall-associated NlpC family hydrolase
LKYLKKISYLSVFAIFICTGFASQASAQDRPRVVKNNSSRPINQPPASMQPSVDKTRSLSSSTPSNNPASRPVLTDKINIVPAQPLVKKTGDSNPINQMAKLAAGKLVYNSSISTGMMRGIQSKLGIRYSYGSSGPNRYDCSGFVWAVFNEAGIHFTRQSARSLWAAAEPVTGDERYKFGTLVFLNGLGHIGIVADENGFYHASSSKGITYSPFKGYWEKRIVGFRRLGAQASAPVVPTSTANPVPMTVGP